MPMAQDPDLASSEPWQLPASIPGEDVPYDEAPPWGQPCAGGPSIGLSRLMGLLRKRFPKIHKIGGYACRPNSANPKQMSMHGTGRAADIYCDRETGDAVANWLVANAAGIGVQLVIWRRSCWNGSKAAPKLRPYGGPNPHEDHVHCEITKAGAEGKTPLLANG